MSSFTNSSNYSSSFLRAFPVLKEFFGVLNGSEIEGYQVSTLSGHYKDGFRVILGCCSDDDEEPITLKVTVEVAVEVKAWHHGLYLQHPLPRTSPSAHACKKMLEVTREEIDVGQQPLVYVTRLTPAPKKMTLNEIRRLSRTLRARHDVTEAEEKMTRRFWLLEASGLEERVLTEAFDEINNDLITKTMVLYSILSSNEKLPLPRLPAHLRRTLALWLMKKHARRLTGLSESLGAFCALVSGVITSGHCPSFLVTNYHMSSDVSAVTEQQCKKLNNFLQQLKSGCVDDVKRCVGIDQPEISRTGSEERERSGHFGNDTDVFPESKSPEEYEVEVLAGHGSEEE